MNEIGNFGNFMKNYYIYALNIKKVLHKHSNIDYTIRGDIMDGLNWIYLGRKSL